MIMINDDSVSMPISQIALAMGVLTSSIGGCRAGCRPRYRRMINWWCVWVNVRRVFESLLGGLSGRVLFEVLSDAHLVVCMGECTQIVWICFGGPQVSSM